MKTFKLKILLLLAVLVFASCKKKEESNVVYLDGNWSVYKVETTELENIIPDYLLKTDQEWITFYYSDIYIKDGKYTDEGIYSDLRLFFVDTLVASVENESQIYIGEKITDTEISVQRTISEQYGLNLLRHVVYLRKE